MDDPNKITIDIYNKDVASYIQNTPHTHQTSHKPMLLWIDTALKNLPFDSHILELGSATPRDALYMRSKGYMVQCSDASKSFVLHLKNQGENALYINALTDIIPKNYSMIIANAVAPHFTVNNMHRFLQNMYEALPINGILAFNVKQGSTEEWVDEKLDNKRFMHYWSPADIKKIIKEYHFETIFIDEDIIGDLPNHCWTNIVVKKSPK